MLCAWSAPDKEHSHYALQTSTHKIKIFLKTNSVQPSAFPVVPPASQPQGATSLLTTGTHLPFLSCYMVRNKQHVAFLNWFLWLSFVFTHVWNTCWWHLLLGSWHVCHTCWFLFPPLCFSPSIHRSVSWSASHFKMLSLTSYHLSFISALCTFRVSDTRGTVQYLSLFFFTL